MNCTKKTCNYYKTQYVTRTKLYKIWSNYIFPHFSPKVAWRMVVVARL